MNVIEISSRENSFLKDLRRLLQDGSAYRKQGRVWICLLYTSPSPRDS